jgi:hypothetical protein
MLASYFSGRFLNRIGAKTVVVTGLTVTGLATILFGCVEGIENVNVFITVCVVIRFIEGAGFSAFFTSALTIVVETFPSDPGYYVVGCSKSIHTLYIVPNYRFPKQGLTESIVTLGMIMGPPIGSYLYSLGGFSLPLVFFGAILCGTAFVSTISIPAVKAKTLKQQEVVSHEDYIRVLKLPETMVSVACTALNVATDVFILINLGEHIKPFNLSVVQEGFTYLCLFLSYGISSPLAGKIGDRTDRELLLQCVGCLLLTGMNIRLHDKQYLLTFKSNHSFLYDDHSCHPALPIINRSYRGRSPPERTWSRTSHFLLIHLLFEGCKGIRESR